MTPDETDLQLRLPAELGCFLDIPHGGGVAGVRHIDHNHLVVRVLRPDGLRTRKVFAEFPSDLVDAVAEDTAVGT